MKKLKFVVSLTTKDNDYQIEQAAAAEETAAKLNVDLKILYAENDAVLQSQQLLKIIQSSSDCRPDAIIFEPVGGTAMPQVARASVSAGIGWAVLNRDVDYISDLRRNFKVPIFSISSDHEEIGRIQGKQIAALLPTGGSVLLIQGPSESLAAKQRTSGMYETKPVGVQVKLMKGNWTESSAHKLVSSWLKLSTSQQTAIDVIAAQDDSMALGATAIDVIAAQDDSMALGAKKAFQEIADLAVRDQRLAAPFLGIDGMPKTGQAWVNRGLLTATIIVPTNAGDAIQIMAHALQTETMPPEKTLTATKSFPAIEELVKHARGQTAGA